jgi:nitroreductase
VSAGAICQNVYLFCASAGLVTVARGWFARGALAEALALSEGKQIVLAQTVGYPA